MIKISKEADDSLILFAREHKLITEEQHDECIKESQSSKCGMTPYALSKKMFSETELVDAIVAEFGLKKIAVSNDLFVNRPLQKEITNTFVKKNRIIPFREEGNHLCVIISDTNALKNLNKVKFVTGHEIEAFIGDLTPFDNYLETLPDEDDTVKLRDPNKRRPQGDPSSAPQNGMPKIGARPLGAGMPNGGVSAPLGSGMPSGQADFTDQLDEAMDKNPKLKEQLTSISPGSSIIEFVNNIIENAIILGVSDIHLETFESSSKIRYRRDGVLQEVTEYNDFLFDHYSAVTTRVKILASLDISERRLPQDGAINFTYTPHDAKDGDKDKFVDIRVSILPTIAGERVVMRILNPDSINIPLSKLGISESNGKKIDKAIKAPQGMVLVTGPTGSGKSTTLYAVLNSLNNEKVNIMTAEDPVEYNVEGIGQVHVKESIGLTFAAALRSFLRQDPEIIMVGEIRDKETCNIAIKASMTGHLVLSTLHTNNAPATITRLLNMGVQPFLVTSSLSLVVAQRLVRVNCPDCRKDDASSSIEKLKALGFPEEEAKSIKVQHSTGCSNCMDTGVKGRKALHEMLEVTDNIREEILKGSSEIRLREVAKEEGFITMQEAGRDLIKDGTITLEEYQRVLIID